MTRLIDLDDVRVEEVLELEVTVGKHTGRSLLLVELQQMITDGATLDKDILQEMFEKEIDLLAKSVLKRGKYSFSAESIPDSSELIKEAVEDLGKE